MLLNERETEMLERIIKMYIDNEEKHFQVVVPRVGTISSWSSKATDIVHACGLQAIERIERGVCFIFDVPGDMDEEKFTNIKHIIHDLVLDL